MEQNKTYAIAIGDAFEGHTIYGPFDNSSDATKWAEDNDGGEQWTMIVIYEALPR